MHTYSNLVLVLGLKSLNKSLRVNQGQPSPARCLQTFVVGGSQGVITVRHTESSDPYQTMIWLCEERDWHRNGGTS